MQAHGCAYLVNKSSDLIAFFSEISMFAVVNEIDIYANRIVKLK